MSKATTMKKILAFLLLVTFLSACSQYTCPTYSKKELKKSVPQNRI
ncbi:MAG: lipoprotein [Cyclobacteriaceae bacterium]